MKDELHQNYGTVTGTPTLVAGATSDGEQGLSFDGATNSVSVPDSASDSLTVADGGVGGAAVVLFVKVGAYPASTKDIMVKSGSYSIQIDSTGKIVGKFVNGANSVTVTSASPISTGAWHHLAFVLDAGYTGTAQIGNSTQIANYLTLGGDYFQGGAVADNNLHVARFQALEQGILTQITAVMVRNSDATLYQGFRAVAYAGTSSAPVTKIAESKPGLLLAAPSVPIGAIFTGLAGVASFEANDYVWLGLIGGGNSNQMTVEAAASGGTHQYKHADISGGQTSPELWSGSAPDAFGSSAGSDALNPVIYGDYTPTGRTGNEGNAILYIDGLESARQAYAHGIADTANNLGWASNFAGQIHKPAIFNRRLTPLEVAYLYSAR